MTRYLALLLTSLALLAVALQCERDGRGIAAAAFAPQEAVLPVLEAVAGDSAPLVWFWWAEDEEPLIVPAAWAEHAYQIGTCESGFRIDAIGDYGRSRGLFQINRIHLRRIEAMGFTWDHMLEGEPNILVAVAIYEEQGWWPWSCARRLGIVE